MTAISAPHFPRRLPVELLQLCSLYRVLDIIQVLQCSLGQVFNRKSETRIDTTVLPKYMLAELGNAYFLIYPFMVPRSRDEE